MKIRIATFNLENMFQRPAAMNGKNDAAGRAAIEDHALANAIVEKDVYSDDDKEQLVELSTRYGWHLLNPPSNALVQLQKIRGKLFRKSKGQPLSVVAKGRGDWTGWFDLRKQDVTWMATYNTARVIAESAADIQILVEVESRPTFGHFNEQVLKQQFGAHYPHYMIIDGNDARGIDVGIASRFPIRRVVPHVDDQYKDVPGQDPASTQLVFSRDCPEYEIDIGGGKTIIVLPNHFKSKRNSAVSPDGGEDEATARRRVQARQTLVIAKEALKRSDYVLIGGDLNDTPDSGPMSELLKDGFEDVIGHPDYPTDRPGTYDTGLIGNKIDYLIMSPKLRQALVTTGIERRGSYHPRTWKPFDTVKGPNDEASDHHLLWAEFEL